MLNKTKLYWISQIVGWLLYAVIVGVFNIIQGNQLNSELLFSLISIFLIGLSVAHAFRMIIVKLNYHSRFNFISLYFHFNLNSLIAFLGFKRGLFQIKLDIAR